jgi:hypothetical protein
MYSGDMLLDYSLFLSFHVWLRKGVDSTIMYVSIVSTEFRCHLCGGVGGLTLILHEQHLMPMPEDI